MSYAPPINIDGISGGTAFATSPATLSHTVLASSNTILIVGFGIDDGNPDTFTSVTYNGVAMTNLGTSATLANHRVSIWFLLNPTQGTNNIVATLSATNPPDSLYVSAISFANVAQVTPTATTGTATSTTMSLNLTSTTPNNVLVGFGIHGIDSVTTIGTTRTIGTRPNNVFSEQIGGIATAGPVGINTIGWTISSFDWAMAACILTPISGNAFKQNNIRPRMFAPGIAR